MFTYSEKGLTKMDNRKFKKLLKSCGFSFSRNGNGSHEIWQNQNGETFAVPTGAKNIQKGIVWNFRRKFMSK